MQTNQEFEHSSATARKSARGFARDFSPEEFAIELRRNGLEIGVGPTLRDVKLYASHGLEISYTCVVNERGTLRRRLSLARAIQKRIECRGLFSVGGLRSGTY